MRVLSLLVVMGLLAGCGEGRKPDSVRKYCELTTMTYQNPQQMRAIHDRGIELFKERKPYLKTEPNRRVVRAATGLVTTAQAAALATENPKLFRGYDGGLGLNLAMAELITACKELPKEKKK